MSASTVNEPSLRTSGASKIPPVSFSASQGDKFQDRMSMQNAVAQMRHNLSSSGQPSESEAGSGPHFEYNIVGVQKTAEKIRSSNASSSNNVARPPVEN